MSNFESNTSTPELSLARAQRLARQASTQGQEPKMRRFSRWVAAAAVVMAVPVVFYLQRDIGPVYETGSGGIESDATVRFRPPAVSPPEVLAPLSGALVDTSDFVVRWVEISGSLYYDVNVVSNMGDLVLLDRVTGTHWQAPPSLMLEPGAEYFVRIDAYLADAKTVSSEHVAFTVRQRP